MNEGFIPAIYEPIILAALQRDSAIFELYLEPQRQRGLIRSLGQVECPGSIVDPEMHGSWMATVFDSCPGCGAQV